MTLNAPAGEGYFIVTPVYFKPAIFPDRRGYVMGGAARQKTILVVDDFEDVRAAVGKALEAYGYRVVEAADGLEAVAHAQSVLPDLILMDLSMPTLDGFAAAHRIRRLFGLGDVPIIAISAHAAQEVRADALAAGFCDYLVKPVDFGLLAEAVAKHMRPDARGDDDDE